MDLGGTPPTCAWQRAKPVLGPEYSPKGTGRVDGLSFGHSEEVLANAAMDAINTDKDFHVREVPDLRITRRPSRTSPAVNRAVHPAGRCSADCLGVHGVYKSVLL